MLNIISRPITTSLCCSFIALTSLVSAQEQPNQEQSSPYSRVIEQDDGKVSLEMCSRAFKPVSGNAPRIHLVSAIHIADKSYYQAMQILLDGYDTVLFEGVKPAGFDPLDANASNNERVKVTHQRLGLLLLAIDMYHAQAGALPQTIAEFKENATPQIATFIKGAGNDGWGNPFEFSYTLAIDEDNSTTTITFTSYGADEKHGGEGINQDISRSTKSYDNNTKPTKVPEGIQTQLAKAINVSFQLDEMNTSKDNWVNADIDMNELNRQLAEYGDDGMFLEMLSGETMQTKIIGFVLNFVSKSPQLSSIMKIVMMDMLAAAESSDIMDQMGAIGEVILEGRNQVVIESIQHQLDTNPNQRDIAVFYGAAHMSGIEETLLEMGYEFDEDIWTQAMIVDTAATGMQPATVEMMRGMIRNSLEQSFESLGESSSED